jgi:hypothetical protein
MYSTVKTRAGTVLIRTELVNQVMPLLVATVDSLNMQTSQSDLLFWLIDVFGEDFEEEHGRHSNELLSKLVLCVLNARHYLIHDKEQFCIDFNAAKLPVRIGFEDAFYPVDQGHWIDPIEFVITSCH